MIIQTEKTLRPRNKRDFYPTPPDFVRAKLKKLVTREPFLVIDPGAGDGVWGIELRKLYPNTFLIGVENADVPRPEGYNSWVRGSYFDPFGIVYNSPCVDLIIGNPPYSLAYEFIDKSLEILSPGGTLVFLLRLAFMESKTRYLKYYSCGLNPKYILPSVQRIPFIPGTSKTDDTAYAVFVWEKGFVGKTEVEWLDWKNDKNDC